MSIVLWQFVRGDDEHAEFIVLPSTEARAILDAWMEEGTYDMTVRKVKESLGSIGNPREP